MKFNSESSFSINRDRLATPISDRWLPSHPKERYGKLPHWYFRTRFLEYGSSLYDLPCRGIRRYPEHNEQIWYRRSVMGDFHLEKFYFIGALLPFHPLFFNANPPLEVQGEQIDFDEPWGFTYE